MCILSGVQSFALNHRGKPSIMVKACNTVHESHSNKCLCCRLSSVAQPSETAKLHGPWQEGLQRLLDRSYQEDFAQGSVLGMLIRLVTATTMPCTACSPLVLFFAMLLHPEKKGSGHKLGRWNSKFKHTLRHNPHHSPSSPSLHTPEHLQTPRSSLLDRWPWNVPVTVLLLL